MQVSIGFSLEKMADELVRVMSEEWGPRGEQRPGGQVG